jgi:hypothetical protein
MIVKAALNHVPGMLLINRLPTLGETFVRLRLPLALGGHEDLVTGVAGQVTHAFGDAASRLVADPVVWGAGASCLGDGPGGGCLLDSPQPVIIKKAVISNTT